uniref:HAD family phosphatase n=1 Tax=Meloidogyne hapla TaxID=6305 RepID=A0A1I8BFC2_MELHA
MDLIANECVFIDDLEKNCLGAEAVGIKSVWLKDGDSKSAIEGLEKILNLKLL